MKNYNSGRSSRRRDFGRGRNFSKPEMHDAICAECGKRCKVPFKPTGDKPIYCSDCFEQKSGGRSERGRPRRRDYPDRSGRDRSRDDENLQEQINLINSKLDSILQILGSPHKKKAKKLKKKKAKKK